MIKEINEQEFELVRKENIALVDFYATWCNPCKALRPVLEEIDNKNLLHIYSLDVDNANNICEEFEISSIPCLILLKDGKEVSRSIGFKPINLIEEWIKENL